MVDIDSLFPGLRPASYLVTSPRDPSYNCIAWAAGITDAWLWPGDPARTVWPATISREQTLEAFRSLFAALGYALCAGEELECGYEKIALYATADGLPRHAARQLPNGRWTSKLGKMADIEHELSGLAGDLYGFVVQIMKRPRAQAVP